MWLTTDKYNNLMRKLDRIERSLILILKTERKEIMDLDQLLAKVTEQKGTADSTKALLEGLSAYIHANSNDPAKMAAIATALDENNTEILNAIAANPVPANP